MTDLLGTRAERQDRSARGDDQGRRPRAPRQQGPAGVLDPHGPLVQLHQQRPRLLARPRDGRREHLHRRHERLRPPDRLVQGLPGRPLVLHRRRRHRRLVRRGRLPPAPGRRARLDGGHGRRGYSDCGATVLANFQQTKISAPPNINEPIGIDQLPDGRILQTVRDGRIRLHDPVTGTSTVIAHDPGLHQQRGRPLRPGDRQQLRRPTSGSTSTTRRSTWRATPGSAASRSRPRRRTATRRPRRPPPSTSGISGRATSSSRASSSSTGRTRRSTWRASRRS